MKTTPLRRVDRRRPLLTQPTFDRGTLVRHRETGDLGEVTLYRPINGPKKYRVKWVMELATAVTWHAAEELKAAH